MNNMINLVKLSLNNFMVVKNMALFIIICFCVSSVFNPQFGLMLISISTYVIAYQTMAYEDSYGIDYLIANLPVTKKQYITSRYVFSLLTLVLSCAIYTLVYFTSLKLDLAMSLSLDYKTILLMGIFTAINLISITVPVLLYFGMKRGRMAMILIFMIVVMIPSVLVNDVEQIMWIVNKLNGMNTLLLAGMLSSALLIISYIISNVLYTKKQLTE